MTEGCLYIAEDGNNYSIKKGEMFILQPRHHHYSWKPMDQQTSYYWIHFFVSGEWQQSTSPVSLHSAIEVPTLHYRTPTLTLHLLKHGRVPDFSKTIAATQLIFNESTDNPGFGFWRSQQLFIDVLQSIQVHSLEESKLNTLSAKTQRYLRDNFNRKITNESLGKIFHFHPNYISRALKETIGLTPNEFLIQYRMEEAEKRLLNSDLTISEIAESIGFQSVYYFSTSFKKYTGYAPQKYRRLRKN